MIFVRRDHDLQVSSGGFFDPVTPRAVQFRVQAELAKSGRDQFADFDHEKVGFRGREKIDFELAGDALSSPPASADGAAPVQEFAKIEIRSAAGAREADASEELQWNGLNVAVVKVRQTPRVIQDLEFEVLRPNESGVRSKIRWCARAGRSGISDARHRAGPFPPTAKFPCGRNCALPVPGCHGSACLRDEEASRRFSVRPRRRPPHGRRIGKRDQRRWKQTPSSVFPRLCPRAAERRA